MVYNEALVVLPIKGNTMQFEVIYDHSYERVLRRSIEGRDFFAAFYNNFLNASEEVRRRFENTDMQTQRRMLKKSFYNLLIFYGSNQADNYLRKIAIAHDKDHLDIKPALYDLWLETLIQTIEAYDEDFNSNVELAWRLIMTPGITYMKHKHQHTD